MLPSKENVASLISSKVKTCLRLDKLIEGSQNQILIDGNLGHKLSVEEMLEERLKLVIIFSLIIEFYTSLYQSSYMIPPFLTKNNL